MSFATKLGDLSVPDPPSFLDPLINMDTCYYYAVPNFFHFDHPNTRWLVTMIKNCEDDRIQRKVDINPEVFKGKNFQMIDWPQFYNPENPSATAMFKKKTVLYLTAVGVAIYLNKAPIVSLLLRLKDTQGEAIFTSSDLQFATHVQDSIYGDFHAFPLFVAMIRSGCFSCARSLMEAGWNPQEPVVMPMRRRFERRAFYFLDWLDFSFSILVARPLYPLQLLMTEMTVDPSAYKAVKQPIDLLTTTPGKSVVKTGLIDVDELPAGSRMLGVCTLSEVVENYSNYLQLREKAVEIQKVKDEARMMGIDPGILMMMAQDYNDGADQQWPITQIKKFPEHLTGGAKNSSSFYASEVCRLLHFALYRNKKCSNLQQCLDSVSVLVKREFFLTTEKHDARSPFTRDTRNVVVLMMNLHQREHDKLAKLVEKIKFGHSKFKHLEEHKLLENRQLACKQAMRKISSVLTMILLHSKEIILFLQGKFPPYERASIDFQFAEGLENQFAEIIDNIICELNSKKNIWSWMHRELILEAAKIPDLHVPCVKNKQIQEMKAAITDKSNKPNKSNSNRYSISFKRVKLKRRDCSSSYGSLSSRFTENPIVAAEDAFFSSLSASRMELTSNY